MRGAAVQVDLVIVGAGFGGSVMAMIAHRLGLSVILLEQGTHPRMAIGESTTPLSNLLLERLNARYDLPRLAPLAKWGTWQRAYPEIGCGLKRGFTFFHHSGPRLLVAASPHDEIADTHWYRADVDHFLVKEAQKLGVDYRDRARIETLDVEDEGATVVGQAGDVPFHLRARLLIDATGPRGFLHRALRLAESPLPGMPATESLYSHFTGVARTEGGDETPYPVDDAAVHHLLEGGWVWVLRFNNGITSAGVAATEALASELALSEGEPAWRRLLERVPSLQSQFEQAECCQPFRYIPAISFRSRTMAGKRWAMLPSAAGFVDPLLSTGFALSWMGVERLARVIEQGCNGTGLASQLESYAQQTECDLLAANRLIGGLYATLGNFPAFTAVSLLYFAAVSFAETAYRLGKPELAAGFLLDENTEFGPAALLLLERAHRLTGPEDTQAYTEDVLRLIEPFNLGGFGDPSRSNCYPVRAEDLLDAGCKLGVTREEIMNMLDRAGFYRSPAPALMNP